MKYLLPAIVVLAVALVWAGKNRFGSAVSTPQPAAATSAASTPTVASAPALPISAPVSSPLPALSPASLSTSSGPLSDAEQDAVRLAEEVARAKALMEASRAKLIARAEAAKAELERARNQQSAFLSEVIGPNNAFHDAQFGLTATYPEGWTVMGGSRWGERSEQNTIAFTPATASSARPSMYYQQNQNPPPPPDQAEAYLRGIAESKEKSRIDAGLSDYKNVPESITYEVVDGRPTLSYYAVFTRGNQVMTEHFIRTLGQQNYVMFFTQGRLEDVQAIVPQIKQMSKTVKVR